MNKLKAWAKVHEDFTHRLLEERIERLERTQNRILEMYSVSLLYRIIPKEIPKEAVNETEKHKKHSP